MSKIIDGKQIAKNIRMELKDEIKDLKEKAKEQTNELLKNQTEEYIKYVQELVSMGNIMNKKFYISVPYHPLSDEHKSFLQSLMDVFKPAQLVKLREKKFKQYKEELQRRVENVSSGLRSIGLNSARMDTQSLIELFYNTYNPDTSENEKLTEIENLRIKSS